MEKTCYWVEYPDKDMAVIVLDDGEQQEIMTGMPGGWEGPGNLLKDFKRRGFVVHAFTSRLEEGEFGRECRRWRRIEDGAEGESVYPGVLAGLGKEVTS